MSINLCLIGGIVLLKLRDCIDCEEAHVISVDKAQVIQVVLLLEDYFVAELF